MRRFVERHGWRAYALPVLVVLTVVALVQPVAHQRRAAAEDRPTVRTSTSASSQSTPMPPPTTVRTITDDTACVGNRQSSLVVVSLHEQHVWMCEKQKQVYSTAATTGATALGFGTPSGTWSVVAKQRDRYLVGPGYRDYVHYWVPFWGDFGFHDAGWQTLPYGSKGYPKHGSHGCVHLPAAAMAWFYKWAQVSDTTVTVVA